MRIYEQNLTGAAGDAGRIAESPKTERSGQAPPAATTNRTDHVDFSSTLGSLSRAVSTDQANRTARIADLTNQVRSGSYVPDAVSISRSMVSEALLGG